MEMYGIRFSNRAKRSDGDDRALTCAEFAAFAALCDSLGLALQVRGVEYSSSWCGYSIDIDPDHQHSRIHNGIRWAARQTLPQFETFWLVEHKDRDATGSDV